jgi:hypothetical protein
VIRRARQHSDKHGARLTFFMMNQQKSIIAAAVSVVSAGMGLLLFRWLKHRKQHLTDLQGKKASLMKKAQMITSMAQKRAKTSHNHSHSAKRSAHPLRQAHAH